MGVEFRLGRNDHRVTEDLLSLIPRSVDAIWVEAQNAARQSGAIEVAHATGKRVFIELQLDRLEYPGFEFGDLPYAPSRGVASLLVPGGSAARRETVEQAVSFQVAAGADLVAPHVFCTDAMHEAATIDLAGLTMDNARGEPVRVVVAASRKAMADTDFLRARRIADELADVGIAEVELRLSPVGHADMSVAAIRSALDVVGVFRERIENVVLGYQGRLGPTALALGEVSAFSVGIGMREHYSIPSLTTAQAPNEDDHFFGPQAGVRLPSVGATVPRRFATALYQDTAIRTRIRCRYQCCTGDIEGPAKDPRRHYLHSRAAETQETLDRPLAWRASLEQERLRRSIELSEMINDGHVPPRSYPIKTRTSRALVDLLETRHGESSAAGA